MSFRNPFLRGLLALQKTDHKPCNVGPPDKCHLEDRRPPRQQLSWSANHPFDFRLAYNLGRKQCQWSLRKRVFAFQVWKSWPVRLTLEMICPEPTVSKRKHRARSTGNSLKWEANAKRKPKQASSRSGSANGGFRISVCSTTRMKSARVFLLIVEGSGSRGCRIFGRVRTGQDSQKAGCHTPSKRHVRLLANPAIGMAWNTLPPLPIAGVNKSTATRFAAKQCS
jgi:hypothetical protein